MLQNRTPAMRLTLFKQWRNAPLIRKFMQHFKIASAIVCTAVLVLCTCGQDLDGNQTASSGSSMGAGGAHCANVFTLGNECGTCLQRECCPEVAACGAVDYCVACYVGGSDFDRAMCTATATTLSDALANCSFDRCKPTCFPNQITSSSSGGGAGGSVSSGSSTSSSGGSGG